MHELQLDGLPGPLLIHGGLATGNLASQGNAGGIARPRAAARACLAKMRTVLELGMPQAVLPPLARPDADFLAACGYDTLATAPPALQRVACSTAYQWTANAATVAPGTDTEDGRTRLLTANLAANLHRAIEPVGRAAQLRRFLPGLSTLPPMPAHPDLGDEGAANHTRLVGPHGTAHLFVHGASTHGRFRPRQSALASISAARLLRLRPQLPVFAIQAPAAVDAGAFHNDVVMVGAGDRILMHAQAWEDPDTVLAQLTSRCGPLRTVRVTDAELTLEEAIGCYLFNSQLLATPHGWVLVAPAECAAGRAAAVTRRLIDIGFVSRVVLVDVRESMRGGGGPACLRLRLTLTDAELAAIDPAIRLTPERITRLEAWVDRHYRDVLSPDDLADPRLAQEAAAALAAWDNLWNHGGGGS